MDLVFLNFVKILSKVLEVNLDVEEGRSSKVLILGVLTESPWAGLEGDAHNQRRGASCPPRTAVLCLPPLLL